ncbi:MAG: hypothetical protein DME76_17770 [Verrucomicrobia bacterium]|nr:MAG: hypothetical protein DME76_17770 [Verrucomicrobiota bacterium]
METRQCWRSSIGARFAARSRVFTTNFSRLHSQPSDKLSWPRPLRPDADTLRPVASPIAHSFAGFWTFLVFAKQLQIRVAAQWRQYLLRLGVLVVLANLPDFDFPISLALLGNTSLHHGFSHSLAAAVLVALAVSCVWRIVPGFWRSAMIYFTAYGSHLLIDLCTGPTLGWTNTSFGIPLLWPWPKKFSSPLILIPGVRGKDFAALFSLNNVWSCTYEVLTCGAITAVALVLWRGRLKSRFVRTPAVPAAFSNSSK